MPVKLFRMVFLLILFVLSASVHANPSNLLDGVREIQLENGMKFLLLRREGAPVFSAYIRVRVGGVDEVDGKTGIAHLLEHMAFKGTPEIGTKDYAKEKVLLEQLEVVHAKKIQSSGQEKLALTAQMNQLVEQAGEWVVKEEFSKIYQRNGATGLNATTSQDLTTYFVTLPNTKLKLWAYLESSRLKDPVFREFYSEREVVGEERRMRVQDSPFGKLYESFIQLAFEKSPYRRPTIGYQEDIEKLSATDLRKFYETYYVPGNIVGTLVGNIDLDETEKILKKYFGNWPSGKNPNTDFPEEPQPKGPKKTVVPFDAKPAVVFGYQKPNMPHPDDYVFDILDQILCEGRTSRLYKRWVLQDHTVQQLNCAPSTPGSRLKNLFFVYATVNTGVAPERILSSFDAEMQRLISGGISAEELEKAKKNILSQWYFDLSSNDQIAEALSYFEAVAGNWKYILNHRKKIQEVTSDDLVRVVQQYLQPSLRRWAYLKPKG